MMKNLSDRDEIELSLAKFNEEYGACPVTELVRDYASMIAREREKQLAAFLSHQIILEERRMSAYALTEYPQDTVEVEGGVEMRQLIALIPKGVAEGPLAPGSALTLEYAEAHYPHCWIRILLWTEDRPAPSLSPTELCLQGGYSLG